jgi:hypothetical protein
MKRATMKLDYVDLKVHYKTVLEYFNENNIICHSDRFWNDFMLIGHDKEVNRIYFLIDLYNTYRNVAYVQNTVPIRSTCIFLSLLKILRESTIKNILNE